MIFEEKTIEYALAYLKIEKANLERFVIENNHTFNLDLVLSAKSRIAEIDGEILEYKKELNDTKIV